MTLEERKAIGPWTHSEWHAQWMYGSCRDCDHRFNISTYNASSACFDSCDPLAYITEPYWEDLKIILFGDDEPTVADIQSIYEYEIAHSGKVVME